MRSARRLSAIVATALFAAVASPAGEPARALVVARHDGAAAPHQRDGGSIEPRTLARSPRAAHQSEASRAHAARDKTFAWLLLLLKGQQGAR